MSRSYVCDGPDCGIVMDPVPVSVDYLIEDEDGDELMQEVHFCSWMCVAAWSTAVCLDYPPLT